MRTTETLIKLEGRVQELLQELRSLKMHVYALEEQNEQLRARLYAKESGTDGRENLVNLYEEGFHVCPLHFGYSRGDNECLFCQHFLAKRGGGEQYDRT